MEYGLPIGEEGDWWEIGGWGDGGMGWRGEGDGRHDFSNIRNGLVYFFKVVWESNCQ